MGYLNTINPEIDGPNPLMCNPYNVSSPSDGQVCHEPTAAYVDPDPGHSLNACTEQVFGANTAEAQLQDPAPMNGFVQQNNKVEPGLVRHFIFLFYGVVLIYSCSFIAG
mgnify:FL=1